jgi:hypothetical protein
MSALATGFETFLKSFFVGLAGEAFDFFRYFPVFKLYAGYLRLSTVIFGEFWVMIKIALRVSTFFVSKPIDSNLQIC